MKLLTTLVSYHKTQHLLIFIGNWELSIEFLSHAAFLTVMATKSYVTKTYDISAIINRISYISALHCTTFRVDRVNQSEQGIFAKWPITEMKNCQLHCTRNCLLSPAEGVFSFTRASKNDLLRKISLVLFC